MTHELNRVARKRIDPPREEMFFEHAAGIGDAGEHRNREIRDGEIRWPIFGRDAKERVA